MEVERYAGPSAFRSSRFLADHPAGIVAAWVMLAVAACAQNPDVSPRSSSDIPPKVGPMGFAASERRSRPPMGAGPSTGRRAVGWPSPMRAGTWSNS
jgi:hypothetical protein